MKTIILLSLLLAQDKRGQMPPDRAPKVGDDAPNFKLKMLGAPDKEVELASFKDKKPVLLVFGSYT
jgi:peroxiredoxin